LELGTPTFEEGRQMRTTLVTTHPGCFMFGKWLLEPLKKWRVILNKREMATLKKAAEILEEIRTRVEDPFEWQEEHRELAVAEACLSEIAEFEWHPLSDYAVEELEKELGT
jgi:hypothetical protein